jgi:hypothetical protein
MALIDCPECGHQISELAESCPSCGVPLTRQPAQLQLQLELTEIDLEWERERPKYVMHTKYGQAVVPNKWAALFVPLILLIVGIGCGIKIATEIPGDEGIAFGAMAGGVFLLAGLVAGFWSYGKAEAYEQAKADYLRKKEAARSKYAGDSEIRSGRDDEMETTQSAE